MDPANKKVLRDYGSAILIAVTVAVLIRYFAIEAYRIPTSAMRPTLEPGDTIFVTKWPIGFNRKVDRGDVLVFGSPTEPGRDYVKRVLGLTGDTVEVKKGRFSLNGKPAAAAGESPTAACGHEVISPARSYNVCWELPLNEDFGPVKVPENAIFVLGDLRNQSASDLKKRRSWGIIPLEAVKGRAQWIWLSVEPHNNGISPARFPNFRFERMFRRIE